MDQINEDQEMLAVIAHLDERLNIEQCDIHGKEVIVVHKDYASRHLFDIERFVKAIGRGWRGGFVEEVSRYSKINTIKELYLSKKFYRLVNDWINRYSDLYRYSARVELFYEVCKDMGLIGERNFQFEQPNDIARADGARYMDAFNMLIEEISVRCQSREFKERERLRELGARRNEESVLGMEQSMFEAKSRWLVLSLTLRYKPKYRRWITPELVQKHRDRFLDARHFNKLISGIRNYVWTIEQGEDTGLHLHVMLFYSSDHNHDEFIAKQICQYWINVVTDGKGQCWNSNQAWLKRRYEKYGHGVGVGQIDWSDAKKREALRKNLVYLAKAEQYLMRWNVAQRVRTFGMGEVPKRGKAGRPRRDIGSES